jgi:2-polyprenyl-3-methyl-5-hydroxy-6-metoxy-1,4-benzoquinol methylase
LKILVAIASHGTRNDHYLLQLVQQYQSMSFDVDIVVLSNIPKNVASKVEVCVVNLRGKDPWSLPFSHKRILGDRLNDYDLFIYSEDDILIREKNLRAFLEVSAVLPEDELPGFLRYEESVDGKINYPDVHFHFHWDPASVRSRGPYTLAFFTNEHAACYVLTQEQLRRAIKSGGYLVDAHEGRYALPETAATDPYTQCGFRKFVCISHLDDFLVHHLPNKYVGTRYGVGDPELRRQVRALLKIAQNGQHPVSLYEMETRLKECAYSKDYYEPAKPDVLSAIPKGVRSVLSIGCGWGAMEEWLGKKGLRVTAIALDSVIGGCAEGRGVEVIQMHLEGAWEKLKGRKFDCLLISNILHLVRNPIEVLSSFTSLLAKDSAVVVIAPNLSSLPVIWKRVRHAERFKGLGNYETSGVHITSSKTLRRWFKSSGLRMERLINILPDRAKIAKHVTLGLMDAWLASEIIAVARRA